MRATSPVASGEGIEEVLEEDDHTALRPPLSHHTDSRAPVATDAAAAAPNVSSAAARAPPIVHVGEDEDEDDAYSVSYEQEAEEEAVSGRPPQVQSRAPSERSSRPRDVYATKENQHVEGAVKETPHVVINRTRRSARLLSRAAAPPHAHNVARATSAHSAGAPANDAPVQVKYASAYYVAGSDDGTRAADDFRSIIHTIRSPLQPKPAPWHKVRHTPAPHARALQVAHCVHTKVVVRSCALTCGLCRNI